MKPLTLDEVEAYLRTYRWSRARVIAGESPGPIGFAQQLAATMERNERLEAVVEAARADRAVWACQFAYGTREGFCAFCVTDKVCATLAALDAQRIAGAQ